MYTIGQKTPYGTFNANMIYDDNGKAICMVYGIASNCKLEDLDETDTEGLRIARLITDALNTYEDFNAS